MLTNVSRRTFLGVGCTAVGAAALGTPHVLRAADEAKAKKYGGYDLGLQSYTLRNYKVDEAIKLTRDLGLTRLEFYSAHYPLNANAEKISEINKLLGDMKPSAHGVNAFSKDHDKNKKIFDFAKAAGIKIITADPTEDSFDSLDKLVKEFDIRIAIHNHGPKARYDKVAQVLTAIKDHDPRIGACADLGHYIRSAEDPVKVITLLKGRLYGIHLKDFDAPKDNAKGVILGKGQLDVAGVFKALKAVDFPADGALSLEYEENPKDPIADIKACLQVAADAAAKAIG